MTRGRRRPVAAAGPRRPDAHLHEGRGRLRPAAPGDPRRHAPRGACSSSSRPVASRSLRFRDGRWRKAGTFLDLHTRIVAPTNGGNEQGLLGLAFHARLRHQRPLLRGLHPQGPGRRARRHGRSRSTAAPVPLRGRRRRPRRTVLRHRPALRQPQRRPSRVRAGRASCTSAWGMAGAAATRRTARRTSRSCWARSCASTRATPMARAAALRRSRRTTRTSARRRRIDLAPGRAQPMALQLRPGDRRPVDRRRGPGTRARRSTGCPPPVAWTRARA